MLNGKADQSQPKTESELDYSPAANPIAVHKQTQLLGGGMRVNVLKRFAPASARSKWFSDLLRAIDEAQWLAWRIGVVEGHNAVALELYVRLEAVRTEVESMRRPSDSPRDLASSGKGLEE